MLHPLAFDLYLGFFIVYQFPLLVAKIFVLCHILWLPTHQTLTCYCNILEPIHFCGSCCLLVILAIGLVSLLFFVTEENYKVPKWSPNKGVRPSPYTTGVPNSQAGVIISSARLLVHEFSSRLTTFQIAGAGDRTADPWFTSSMLTPYTTRDSRQYFQFNIFIF